MNGSISESRDYHVYSSHKAVDVSKSFAYITWHNLSTQNNDLHGSTSLSAGLSSFLCFMNEAF